jgi:hypothetical protein
MGKKSGSGIRIRNEKPGSYFRELKKIFFGVRMLNSLMRIRDPGWKKIGIEKVRIRDGKIWIRNRKIRIRDGKNSDPG